MPARKYAQKNRTSGMTLVELIVTSTLVTLVVAGSASASLLLVKVAADHENRADMNGDIRNGMEVMSYDIRNADGVGFRNARAFQLTYNDASSILYKWDTSTKTLFRKQDGDKRNLFENVTTFDVLRDSSDAPSGITYDDSEIMIEELEIRSTNGTGKETQLKLTNFAVKIRNS